MAACFSAPPLALWAEECFMALIHYRLNIVMKASLYILQLNDCVQIALAINKLA